MITISVIVPVFNAERYLDRCISSVLRQTHPRLELILVNDGSTDSSGTICEKWASEDLRVKVIHQKNQGVSAARNAGLDAATGEYIGFVDADDEILPETYEIALSYMKEHDIVMWDAITVWGDGRTEPDTIPLLGHDCTLFHQDWYPELLRQMAGSVWRCLYRASCIAEIRFSQGVKLSEDRLFNLYAMGRAEKLRYIKAPLYRRLMHAESAVHRYHEDHLETNIIVHRAMKTALKQVWHDDSGYVQAYNRQLINGAMGAASNYFYKTSPLTLAQKWEKTWALCENAYLQMILAETENLGLRGVLMKYKLVPVLCVVAWLTNKKHGR